MCSPNGKSIKQCVFSHKTTLKAQLQLQFYCKCSVILIYLLIFLGSPQTPNNISDESPSILEYSDYVVQEAANLGLMCVPMAIFDQHYASINPINANISQEEYPQSPLDRSYQMLPDTSNISDETYMLQGGSPLGASSPLDRGYRRLPDTSNISQEDCSLVGGSPLGVSPHDRGYRSLPNTSNISQEDYPLVGGSPLDQGYRRLPNTSNISQEDCPLVGGSPMGPSDRTYSIPRDRTYNIPRDRTYSIPRDRTYSIPRDRTYSVPPRDRTYSIPPRDRTYSIPPRDRTYSIPNRSRGGSQNISREEHSLMGGSSVGSSGNQCSPHRSPMSPYQPPIRSIAHLSVIRQINFDTPSP